MTIIAQVQQIRIGKAQPFARNSISAINKQVCANPIEVLPTGLLGDEVGDTRHHGGVDKAVHCYALANYADWQTQFPHQPLFQAGGFGENLCIQGTDETQVCLGDEWQIGTARFVVSQPRLPCWKLNERFDIADVSVRAQQNGKCGWYLRVVQTGQIQAGDPVLLLARPHPNWTMAQLLDVIDRQICDAHIINALLDLPLPESWHNLLRRRLETGVCENMSMRLQGFQAA